MLGIDGKVSSRLTTLSNSVMNHPALNDVTDDSYESSDDGKSLMIFKMENFLLIPAYVFLVLNHG